MRIGEYDISEIAQFWVYNLSPIQWQELQNHFDKSEQFFITSYKEYEIKKGDMILIHVKTEKKQQGGFIGYCQMLTGYEKNNTKFKIYQDDITNKHYGKIDKFTYFQELVNINKLEDFIKKYPDFRSLSSFKMRFLTGMIEYKQIPRVIGQQILIQLENFEFEEEKKPEQKEKPKTQVKEIKEIKEVKQKIKVIDDDSDDISLSLSSKDKVSSYKESEEDISNDEYQTEEYYDEEENESYDDGYDYEKHKNGIVPIMIDPCKDFKMPEEDWDLEEEENWEIKKVAFIEHYIECYKCDTTNNSNIDIIRLLQKGNISFMQVDSFQEDFINALEQYHEGRIYNPFLEEKKTKLRLLYVKDDCDTYDQCILIEGCLFIDNNKKKK